MAALRHVFQFLPGLALRLILRARPHPFPLAEESFHLRVMENRFAVRINATQDREVHLVARGDHAVQHIPFAVFPKIVFQLYHQRHG
ncbi:MAG: hypothetical protein DMG70_20270 [Acidobacteria bacterium]|nr:MAG: hypothetical protein DMG70_20270 [Acidobacteriota bacterium]